MTNFTKGPRSYQSELQAQARGHLCNRSPALNNTRALALGARIACVSVLLLACGCARRHTVVEAFPTARLASPWVLDGSVWSGSFEQAALAMGADAEAWRKHGPNQAWLAVYQHESRPKQKLTARILGFADETAAHAAFDAIAPLPRRKFKAGHEGCWTDDGVLFRWGRLTVEVFSSNAAGEAIAEQAVYLVGFIEKRMPAGLPENPQ